MLLKSYFLKPALSKNLKNNVSYQLESIMGSKEFVMKWAGIYLVGFVILIGGLLAALWEMGVLAKIGATWTLIGIAIAIGIGIMLSVSRSGSKENIQINKK